MNLIDFISQYTGEAVTAIIASLGTWIFSRKKENADINTIVATNKSLEANAIEAMQKAYDIYVDHNNRKLEDLEKEIAKLKQTMIDAVTGWELKYRELEKELVRVEKYWQDKYKALKKSFDDYRRLNPNNEP